MMMGSTERRIACLKIAAAMNKRMTKEDPIVSVEALIEYAGTADGIDWDRWRESRF